VRFGEFKIMVKEAATTQSITVRFTDGTSKAITDIPMTVFTSANFEQNLKIKMTKNFPNKEYSRFTIKLDFTPTAEEKQHMDNVINLYTLIEKEWKKLFVTGGENKPFPNNISFSYKVGDASNIIPDVKKDFNITAYKNTKNPKSDKFGTVPEEGWPMSIADLDELKQLVINKIGADKDIILAPPPQSAAQQGDMFRVNAQPDSLQYKRELDMYNGGSE
jgi:hypothetical protein